MIAWVVIGVFSGAVAPLLDQGKVKGGFPISIAAGVLGALGAGFLSSMWFNQNLSEFSLLSALLSAAGGLTLVLTQRIALRESDEDNSGLQDETWEEKVQETRGGSAEARPKYKEAGSLGGESNYDLPKGTTVKFPTGDEFVTGAPTTLTKKE